MDKAEKLQETSFKCFVYFDAIIWSDILIL